MAILSLTEMTALKKSVSKYGYHIHIHDTCGGQSFELQPVSENPSSSVYGELENFFAEHNMTIQFYDTQKLNFIAK